MLGNVDFMESTGHIIWRGIEFAKVRSPESSAPEPALGRPAPVAASPGPVLTASASPAAGASLNLVELRNAIEAGREVSVPVKYNSAVSGYMYMADGRVTVTRTSIVFKATYGSDDLSFVVAPEKILDAVIEPPQGSRLHLTVAVKNKKGDKENKKNYYLYSAGARAVGGGQGGQGATLDCSRCDGSMDVLRSLLLGVRR